MNKLVTVFSALAVAAGIAQGEVKSANVVGYNETEARANLNFYAPMFLDIGFNTIDINSIQLDDDGAGNVGWGDVLQIVGPLGSASEMYAYWDKSMGDGVNNFWGDGEFNPVEVSFDRGDGVAIDNPNGNTYKIVMANQVSDEPISFDARANLNWSGNPFPASININAIQLDDDGAGNVGWGDVMQIVGPLGSASEMYAYWDKSMGDGVNNFWGDGEFNPVDVTLAPGAGFAIDNPNGNVYKVTIASPYTL